MDTKSFNQVSATLDHLLFEEFESDYLRTTKLASPDFSLASSCTSFSPYYSDLEVDLAYRLWCVGRERGPIVQDSASAILTHVSIWYEGKVWSLPKPNRHHNVIHLIAETNGKGVKDVCNQGFLIDSMFFVDRKRALIIARANGQLNRRAGPGYYQGEELYSEDLW